MAFASQQAARDAVRSLVGDGMPSYATTSYGLVRQEQLADQIQAQSTPTGTVFYVRFSNVPLGKNVTVTAVPGTIAAYVDGNPAPKTIGNGGVTADIDQNGNFTLAVAPISALLVTYGWQAFSDGDIDQLIAGALAWLFDWTDIGSIPQPVNNALSQYAAGLACQALARRCRLPDVGAGEAKEALSKVAEGYEQDAKDFMGRAAQARKDYWSSADQPLQPAGASVALRYPNYQPRR